jgi:hypothetical protein
MKIFAKVLSLFVIFVLIILTWPDFSAGPAFDCSNHKSIIEECPVVLSVEYNDWRLGGGLRWVQRNICINDGTLTIASDDCAREEARYFPLGDVTVVGAIIVTISSLILFGSTALKRWLTIKS